MCIIITPQHMAKVTQSISFEFDDFSFLIELQSKYHLKNISKAIERLIYYYKIINQDKQTAQKPVKEARKIVNPMVNP